MPLVGLALLSGCDTQDRPPGTVVRDSAGVRIAAAQSARWEPADAWAVPALPSVSLGVAAGHEPEQFTDLVGATRLSDGRLVAADRGSGELRFFGPDGRFLGRTGGEGDGPGEFRALDHLLRFADDSLLTWDGRARRLQVFAPGGAFARVLRVAVDGETVVPDQVVGMVADTLVVMTFLDFGGGVPSGVVPWPAVRLALVHLGTGDMEEVRTVPGQDAHVEPRADGGYRHGAYLFAKGPEFATAKGAILGLRTDTFAVHVLDLQGTRTATLRRDTIARRAGPGETTRAIDGWVDVARLQGSPPEALDRLRQSLLDTPRASTLPLLRDLVVDAGGHIWVEPWFFPGSPPPAWEVFAPDGTWLGAVALPAGLDRGFVPNQAPRLEIGPDYVLGVWTDELDLEYVRLYPLVRPAG